MRQVKAQIACGESRCERWLAPFVVFEANRRRWLRQVAGNQVAQHRAPRDEAIAMYIQVKSIGARRLIRIQYCSHASKAHGRAVKPGEPQMNFAAFEFYCVCRTVHAADDYTGIDRSYRNRVFSLRRASGRAG